MTRRRPRARQPRGRSLVGTTYDLDVGPVAHGGHFVARHEGRVVFVRHALPGERVTARVTEGDEGSKFLRADAVSVTSASPARVTPSCPYAGPDACGGCDFQHVAPGEQRRLKASVVQEQLERLAGLSLPVTVEPVPLGITSDRERPPEQEGLRWRTRVRYAVAPDGRRGFRKHRSHDVVPVDDCLITRLDARVEGETETPVFETVETSRGTHAFTVAADGFWQVHVDAPRVLVEAVLALLEPRPGERCLDLYAGVGLFSAFLADAVGDGGQVTAVEGNRVAAENAVANLESYRSASVAHGAVDRWLASTPEEPVDLVVLDPPREGAKRAVVERLVARTPRAVAYVACDPAALARDVALFAAGGYRLTTLRAFDLFPMTHHVECVALLEPADDSADEG